MKYILSILMISITLLSSGQELKPDEIEVIHYFRIGQNIFWPSTELENKSDTSFLFCNEFVKEYYLYELALPKEIFSKLNIRTKSFPNRIATYKYIFSRIDNKNCLSSIEFHLEPKARFYLNNNKITTDCLINIESSLISRITIRHCLFGKTRIKIITTKY